MSDKEHYAEITPASAKFRAEYNGTILAESDSVRELQEYHPQYEFAPVAYFPPDSIRLDQLESNENHTSCPIKGEASYWNFKGDGVENIAWAYKQPLEHSEAIAGHLAFDQGKGVKIFRNDELVTRRGIKKR